MRTIEESRYFRYVAWTLVIGFATFTGFLALRLRDVAESIAAVGA